MNKRLQQFLDLENLSPARLADIMGVQRSGMSHILSGRNKPSHDFTVKLLLKFPELDANWFLTGKGKPYKEMNSYASHTNQALDSSNFPAAPTSQKNLQPSQAGQNFMHIDQSSQNFSQALPQTPASEDDHRENSHNSEDLFAFDGQQAQNNESQNFRDNNTANQNNLYTIENEIDKPIYKQEYRSENEIKSENKAEERKKRSVKRVIIFYNDGSFEEFYPSGYNK